MMMRQSQRKAVQRLSGGAAAAAVLFSALGFSPTAGLVLARLNTDGSGGAVSGAGLTNTAGLTIPSAVPDAFSVSPDGNWLIVGWSTGAVPATQLYKRAGSKSWAYYGPLASAPTVGAVTNYDYVRNFPFVFSATSDRLVYAGSGPGNNTFTPIYWTLSVGVWSYQGNMPNTAGGFGYAESSDGLLRLQTGVSTRALRGNYNGGAVSLNISAGYYDRVYISPLGTYVAFSYVSGSSGRFYQLQRTGTTLTFLRDFAFNNGHAQPSAGFWLSESVIVYGVKAIATSSNPETLPNELHMFDLANNTKSTIRIDAFDRISPMQDIYQDSVVDVFLVSPGVLGYVTVKGSIGTANFAGTTFTGLGPVVAIKQPALTGAVILRVP